MSVLSGPPLWGSVEEASNLFPIPPRVARVYINGQPLDIPMKNGVFSSPVALRRGVHTELSFDIPEANLGRPHYFGKPGFFRNVPPNAMLFLATTLVYLYCDQVARAVIYSFAARAPTGHLVIGALPSNLLFDIDQGRTRVYLEPSAFMDGPTLVLWGLSFRPALFTVVPV